MALPFCMDLPTFDFVDEENLEYFSEGLEMKMNSAGEKLNLVFALIEPSIDSLLIEFDCESSCVKFVAESDKHLLDVIIAKYVIINSI